MNENVDVNGKLTEVVLRIPQKKFLIKVNADMILVDDQGSKSTALDEEMGEERPLIQVVRLKCPCTQFGVLRVLKVSNLND